MPRSLAETNGRPSRWLLVCVACLVVFPTAVRGQTRDVVGRWESVEVSSGGLGTMLTFFEDGTVAVSPGVVVDGPYRLDGSQLVWGDRRSEETVGEVTIVGDTLIEAFADHSVRSLRVGGPLPGEHAITGAWEALGATLGIGRFMTFDADVMRLRIPFGADRGTYIRDGDSLIVVVNLEGTEVWLHGFLRGTTLELGDAGGKRFVFRRARAHFDLGSRSPASSNGFPGRSNNKFAGMWSNIDPDSRGLTKLLISQDNGVWLAQAWGQCEPKDCDWGKVPLHLIGASVQDTSFDHAFATWEPRHAVTHVIMRLHGEELMVEGFTLFRDNSGRSNFRTAERLSRAP